MVAYAIAEPPAQRKVVGLYVVQSGVEEATLMSGIALSTKYTLLDELAAEVIPLPLRATVCTDPAALSVMLRAAFNSPEAAGVKVTVIVQLAPAATLVPHMLVCE